MTWLVLESYAEEREGYTPSYRASIERRMPIDGDAVRARVRGEIVETTFDAQLGFLDADGCAVEPDEIELP